MNVGKEFAVLFGVLFLPSLLAQGSPVDAAGFEQISYHLMILAVSVPQVLLVVYVSNLRRPGSSERFGWRRPIWKDVMILAVGFPAAIVVAMGTGAIVGEIGRLLAPGGAPLEPAVDWSFSKPSMIPLAAISTLAIGYREEIFYRAYLTDRAAEIGIPPVPTILGASVLFAAGHVYQGILGFFVALMVGSLFAVVYYRTRSLNGVAIAHGLYNLTILLASGSSGLSGG